MTVADARPEWSAHAACIGTDPLAFYPEHLSRTKRAVAVAVAKSICATCSVRIECLNYALQNREPYGVWGGLDVGERDRIGGPR